MIETIEIRNFRTHRNTKLELSSGVNVIIGESCSGKSNILRAVRWLFENKPAGFGFHSNLPNIENETEVRITLVEGPSITICRSEKTKTSYEINYNDGSEIEVYSTMGRSNVPKEVTDLLAFGEINFQNQLSPHFLFSPSEMGKVISDAVGNEEPDKMRDILNARKNENNGEVLTLKKSIAEDTEKLKSIKDSKVIIDLSEEIQKLQSKINEDGETISALVNCAETISQGKEKVFELKIYLSNLTNSALPIRGLLQEKASFEKAIINCKKVVFSSNKKNRIEALLKRTKFFVSSFKKDVERYEVESKHLHNLSRIVSTWKEADKKKCGIELKQDTLEKDKIEVLKSGKYCDKCGQLIRK